MATPGVESRGLTLLELYSLVMLGKRTIAASLILVMAATAFYTYTSSPTYEASALVLIDLKARQGNSPFVDLTGIDAANKITNEIETLRSSSLASDVADSLLTRYRADKQVARTLPVIVKAEETAAKGTMNMQRALIEAVQAAIDIASVKESDIIKVTARSESATEAALLANTYARIYTQRNVAASRIRSRNAREFLQDQLLAKRHTLDSSETNLQSYMTSSGMVALDVDTKRIVEQLAQLEASRDAVEVDMSSRTKTLESNKQQLAKLEPSMAKSLGEYGDAYIKLLQEQLARLEVQRDLALSQVPPGDKAAAELPQIRDVDDQIKSLRMKLQERTREYISTSVPSASRVVSMDASAGFLGEIKQKIIEEQTELDGLAARKNAVDRVIAEYERQFNRIPEKSIQLAKLQRSRLSNEKLYLMLEEKFNEAAITESSELGYTVLLDPAMVPLKPVRPVVLVNLIVGFFLGLGLGMFIAVLRAVLDVRITAAEDIKRQGYTVLATVGRLYRKRKHGAEKSKEGPYRYYSYRVGAAVEAADRTDSDGLDPRLIIARNPLLPQAEAYRLLRTGILRAYKDTSSMSILVTSPNPGEGKTTTASNLAIAFTELGKRVLLVDADLRRPALHTVFDLKGRAGLPEYLNNKATIEQIVYEDVFLHLDVVCAGTILENPSVVLVSAQLECLINHGLKEYNVIIFDTPPLKAVGDASLLSTRVDASLIVVAAGKTTMPELKESVEGLAELGARVLGVVLNKYDTHRALRGTYGSQGYGYYGYGYNAGYGSKYGKNHKKKVEAQR